MTVFKLFLDPLKAYLTKLFQTLVVNDFNFVNIVSCFDLKEFIVF